MLKKLKQIILSFALKIDNKPISDKLQELSVQRKQALNAYKNYEVSLTKKELLAFLVKYFGFVALYKTKLFVRDKIVFAEIDGYLFKKEQDSDIKVYLNTFIWVSSNKITELLYYYEQSLLWKDGFMDFEND